MTRTRTPLLPHAADAERSVLGAALLRPDVLEWLDLGVEDFYDPRHRAVWAAMRAARATGAVDATTVGERLEARGRLDAVGGLAYLSELAIATPTADNVEHYAAILRRKRVYREWLIALGDMQRLAAERGLDGDELVGLSMELLAGIRPSERPRGASVSEILRRRMFEVAKLASRKQAGEDVYVGIPTGLSRLDRLIGGIPVGPLSILAGRPSHGKSTVAIAIAEHAAALGVGVVFYGLEDGEDSLAGRIAARRAGVDSEQIRNLSLDPAGWRAVSEVVNAAGAAPDWCFVEAPGMSAEDVVRDARARRHEMDPKGERKWLVIVDYAQLMRWPERADGEPAALSLGTRTLGAFAGRDKVALLLLVQLNRDLEKREDKRPRLSDMKGSGEFEQHARLVLMVYHEAAHVDVGKIADPEERAAMQSKLEIAVRKNHDGQNNKVAVVHWDQPRHRVVDAAWDDVPRATTPTNGARSQATFRLGDDPPPPTDDDVPF